jgi:hypothetical protein
MYSGEHKQELVNFVTLKLSISNELMMILSPMYTIIINYKSEYASIKTMKHTERKNLNQEIDFHKNK